MQPRQARGIYLGTTPATRWEVKSAPMQISRTTPNNPGWSCPGSTMRPPRPLSPGRLLLVNYAPDLCYIRRSKSESVALIYAARNPLIARPLLRTSGRTRIGISGPDRGLIRRSVCDHAIVEDAVHRLRLDKCEDAADGLRANRPTRLLPDESPLDTAEHILCCLGHEAVFGLCGRIQD